MLPAEVIAWSSSEPGRATVQPTIRLLRRSEGVRLAYRPPPLAGAPVAWPGGGEYGVTWPLEPGSTGMLVFSDRSLDEWAVTGQEDNTPRDLRRHAYADGVFVPGLRALATLPTRLTPSGDYVVVGCPTSGEVRLGSAGATSPVALGSLTDDQFTALANAFSSWTPVANDGGAALKTILTTLLASWPSSVGSARVRSE